MAPSPAASPSFGYTKKEKLKSRKTLEGLFAEGRSFTEFPVKVWYQALGEEQPHQIGVGVSSRNFKKATDRNRIKRLLREAYRLQKANLVSPQALGVFLLYVGKELPTQSQLMVSVLKALEKLSRMVQPSAAANPVVAEASPVVDITAVDPGANPPSSAPSPPETSGHV